MTDEKDEKDTEELEKASDIDIVRGRLKDEESGLDALAQVLESTNDPRLREILEAIEQDEQKHNAALQAWMDEASPRGDEPEGQETDEGEEMPEEEGESPADEDTEPEEGVDPELDKEEAVEDLGEDDLGDTGEDMIPEEDEAIPGDKDDLIADIQAVLAEHSGEGLDKAEDEDPGDEGDGDTGDDEDEERIFGKSDEGEDLDEEEDDTGKRCSKSIMVDFIKSKGDQRIVYGVVSEPDTIDLQGDRLSKSEIRKACHKFMMESQKIGKEHESEAKADIIESYIAPVDFKCNGQVVKAGSWVMAVKIHDEDLWQAIKKGDITGFSIAGKGTRTPF